MPSNSSNNNNIKLSKSNDKDIKKLYLDNGVCLLHRTTKSPETNKKTIEFECIFPEGWSVEMQEAFNMSITEILSNQTKERTGEKPGVILNDDRKKGEEPGF